MVEVQQLCTPDVEELMCRVRDLVVTNAPPR